MDAIRSWFFCSIIALLLAGQSKATIETRIKNGIKYHILQSNPNEAWRLLILSQRLKINLSHQNYLSHLTMAMARSCPLIDTEDIPFDLLLSAYIYRYHLQFQHRPYNNDPYFYHPNKEKQYHFNSNLLPYLDEIAETQLLQQQGCYWLSSRLRNHKSAKDYELEHLIEWYRHPKRLPISYEESVYIRILWLTRENKDLKELRHNILRKFIPLKLSHWNFLKFEEQVFLWEQLINESFINPPPYAPGSKPFQFILSIILNSHHILSAQWLGLINYNQISFENKSKLINHLVKIDNFRDFTLHEQASMAYQSGKFLDALNIIRRLLLLNEAQNNNPIIASATKIAHDILIEYRFEKVLAGVVRKSLPRHTWNKLAEEMLIELALTGDQLAFHNLLNFTKESYRYKRRHNHHLHILESLAKRNLQHVDHLLSIMCSRKRMRHFDIRFIEKITTHIIGLRDQYRIKLQPFQSLVAKCLKSHHHTPRLEKIYNFYLKLMKTKESQGMEQVLQGVQNLGVVKLNKNAEISIPFKWDSSLSPPLMPLVAFPKSYNSNDWIVWTKDEL